MSNIIKYDKNIKISLSNWKIVKKHKYFNNYIREKKAYLFFSKNNLENFNIPKIIKFYDNKKIIEMENIDWSYTWEILKSKIKNNLEFAIKLFKNLNSWLKSLHNFEIRDWFDIDEIFHFDRNNPYMKNVFKSFGIQHYPIEKCFVHWDLTFDNIMYKDDKLYFIDFTAFCISDKYYDFVFYYWFAELLSLDILLKLIKIFYWDKFNYNKFETYVILKWIKSLDF